MNKKTASARATKAQKKTALIEVTLADVEEKTPLTGERVFVAAADRIGLEADCLPVRLSVPGRSGKMMTYQMIATISQPADRRIVGFRYLPHNARPGSGYALEIFTEAKNITL